MIQYLFNLFISHFCICIFYMLFLRGSRRDLLPWRYRHFMPSGFIFFGHRWWFCTYRPSHFILLDYRETSQLPNMF